MRDKRPRIGITMRYDSVGERFYLSRHYSEAVESAGGAPIHVPLIPRQEYICEAMEGLDAVLLPGSASDVDPLLYGHEPHEQLGDVHTVRDATDMLILEEAERRRLPLLAICYGMQILNVMRGGTLIQDIKTEIPKAIKHEQGEPRDRRSHRIKFLEGSRLARLAEETEATVNSHHHQGVGRIGRDLLPTAWTADGLVEAVEDGRPDRFVIGVQWHPELNWRENTLEQRLFVEFVEAARVSPIKSKAEAVEVVSST